MIKKSFRLLVLLLTITSSGLICSLPQETLAQEVFSDQAAPPVPTNLKAVYRVGGSVKLTWDNVKAPAVSEFHIFRLENYSPDTTLKTIAVVPHTTATPNPVVYEDKTIQPGRKYTYFVTSKDRFGSLSGNSKMFTIDTPDTFHPPR